MSCWRPAEYEGYTALLLGGSLSLLSAQPGLRAENCGLTIIFAKSTWRRCGAMDGLAHTGSSFVPL